MATLRVDAGVTKFNASPLILGANRNHVHLQDSWANQEKYKPQVVNIMRGLRATWGSSQYGSDTFIYRLGHGPTDGRYDLGWAYGYHWENWFQADGKAQDIYPYDDIMHGLNEAVEMGGTPLMVVNLGTGWGPDEAGRLASYCNKASDLQRTTKNPARASNPYNVKYWELGNELSWNQVRGHPDNEIQYASIARNYAKAIRDNSDIEVKIAAGSYVNMSLTGNGWVGGAQGVRNLIQNFYVGGELQLDAVMFHGYPSWPVADKQTSEASKLAVTTWHQMLMDGVRTGVAQETDKRIEFWNTEYFPHYYSTKDQGMFGALYGVDWQIYQINNDMPIAVPFCMWHKEYAWDNFGDNIFFYNAEPSKKTPWLRWMEMWAKNWGNATLHASVLDSPRWTQPISNWNGMTSLGVDKVNVAASKSADGKILYIMVINRTNDSDVPLTLDFLNFTWNPGMAVTVRKLKGNAGWNSEWNNVSMTQTNWTPASSGNTFTSERGSLMLLTIQGQATPPNNGGTVTQPPTQEPPPVTTTPYTNVVNPTPSSVPLLASIREIGANVIRVTARWDKIEQVQGVRDFLELDQAVFNAKALGGRVLLTLFGTPAWAAEEGENKTYRNPTNWAHANAYLTDIATRYKEQVWGYELWFEPNNDATFYTGETATVKNQKYLTLLDNYTTKLLSIDTNANIVLGGMLTTVTDWLGMLTYLYQQNRRDKWHYVGIHAYPGNAVPWDTVMPGKFDELRLLMDANGDNSKQIAVTGTSMGTNPVDHPLQAQRVVRAYALMHLPKWQIAFACYEPFYDKSWDSTKSGLLDTNQQKKMSWTAYRTLAALLVGKVFVKQMTLGMRNWGLEFKDPATNHSVYMVWTDNETVSIPVELPLKTNHVNIVLPQNGKYTTAVLLYKRISFTLKRDVMIIQELDDEVIEPGNIPGMPPTTYDPTTERPSPINLNNAKFEPTVNGLTYLGATLDWNTAGELETLRDNWEAGVSHKPYIINLEIEWDDMGNPLLVDDKMLAIKNQAAVPMVTLRTKRNTAPTTKQIGSGSHNANLRALALRFKDLNWPIFFRFEPDFNTKESRACVANATGMQAADYINAWRNIYDVVRSEGVDNVAFVWCPSIMPDPITEANGALNYYPGDAYVDWVGLNVYIHGPWTNYVSKFKSGVLWGQEKKPIMVCELGVADPTTSGYDRLEALEQFFDNVELKYPMVKGLLYYNIDVNVNYAYRLENQPEIENVWQDRTLHERYIVSGIELE